MASTEMPETKPEERISLDEMGHDKTDVMQKGGTVVDEREMSRMGKKQELRVSQAVSIFGIGASTDMNEAQFQIRRHSWIHHDPPVHLGVHDPVQLLRLVQRRDRGRDLVHHCRVDLLLDNHSQHGGAGKHGPNGRR